MFIMTGATPNEDLHLHACLCEPWVTNDPLLKRSMRTFAIIHDAFVVTYIYILS